MRFIVDAQLPRRLAREIRALGHEAVHTLDLPAGNRTTDSVILATARSDRCVVVTKDRDFVDSFMLRGEPEKLLLVATGNISNDELLPLLRTNWTLIVTMLEQGDFLEVSRTKLVLHR